MISISIGISICNISISIIIISNISVTIIATSLKTPIFFIIYNKYLESSAV